VRLPTFVDGRGTPLEHLKFKGVKREMKKLTLSILATALVVASTPVFADQPNGQYVPNTNNGNGSKGNVEGVNASAIIQNGQFVRVQAQSGQRSDLVHDQSGFPGLGGK
jgi:hypothetical protein